MIDGNHSAICVKLTHEEAHWLYLCLWRKSSLCHPLLNDDTIHGWIDLMVMEYWSRRNSCLRTITNQVIKKTLCTLRLQHHVILQMHARMRTASRNMRLWCGSAAATFGRHRSRKSPWSGEGWPRWALGFSAPQSWRLGRSPREKASV